MEAPIVPDDPPAWENPPAIAQNLPFIPPIAMPPFQAGARPFFATTISITSTVVVISGDGVFCFRVHPSRGPECIGPIHVLDDLED